jgi:hypothetical protein
MRHTTRLHFQGGFMKRFRKSCTLVVLLFASTAGAAKIALAPGVPGLEDASVSVNLQIQTWVQSVENQAPNGTSWNTQIFLRRIRPSLAGDITKQFHFFFQLDSPNFGRNGTAGDPQGIAAGAGQTHVVVQDAQAIYEPTPGVFIEAGQLLLPLSHNQVQSTTSFVTLDLHSNTLRFPGWNATAAAGTGQTSTATTGLRELGVASRGWLFDKKVGYRVGVYNGARGTGGTYDPNNAASTAGLNPDGIPQFGAYLHYNFLDTEERGWLYQGVYFNDKPILSVGVGGGFQPKAIHNVPNYGTGPQDWRALAADLYAAIPPGPDQEIIAQGTYYNYDFGDHNPNTGNGFFVEFGYRFGTFQPEASFEYFSANDTHTNDARIWTAGINWWYRRINSLKLEFGTSKLGTLAQTTIRSLTAQWQIFF